MRFFVLMVLLLRFPSLVLSLSLSGKRPRTNQGRTKEWPKNSKTQKSTFVKISVSFTSLVPCLIPPIDDRETTERTTAQLLVYKKCYLLRLPPKKVDFIPKKVVPIPKKVDRIPKMWNSVSQIGLESWWNMHWLVLITIFAQHAISCIYPTRQNYKHNWIN